MSKIAIQGDASGTGTFTVAAPNSNSDRTLTLPDATGTLNTSGLANEVPAGTAAAPAVYPTGDSNTGVFFPAADTVAVATGGTERARIDSSGNLLVGTTSTSYSSSKSFIFDVTQGYQVINHPSGQAAGSSYILFGYNTGGIGSITQNGTTAVAYNTSSDYRLKENIQPMTGALAKVAALKPVTYTWKADASAGEGFIAHELAEVVPQCVTGEKDAVDAEGSPVYQGIDTSFLVATLAAAIQELKALVDTQAASIAALEARLASDGPSNGVQA